MIFTFQKINSIKRYMFFAENKNQAFTTIKENLGEDADNWSLIAYTPVEQFAIYL